MRTAGIFVPETLPPNPYYQYPEPPPVSLRWRTTVPIYLFGGLAAMLGLIAFALLILACSYWRLSDFVESAVANEGKESDDGVKGKGEEVVVNSVLVIMAGEENPTFLATAMPAVSKTSSIGGGLEVAECSNCGGSSGGDGEERREKLVVELS